MRTTQGQQPTRQKSKKELLIYTLYIKTSYKGKNLNPFLLFTYTEHLSLNLYNTCIEKLYTYTNRTTHRFILIESHALTIAHALMNRKAHRQTDKQTESLILIGKHF